MAVDEITLAEQIGLEIRRLRKRRGLTMKQVEARTGIPTSMLSRYESGLTVPTTERLVKLARAFEVRTGDLVNSAMGL